VSSTMYRSNVTKLSFGSIIFKDMNESTLVRNPRRQTMWKILSLF
jgi:hypothetical protein